MESPSNRNSRAVMTGGSIQPETMRVGSDRHSLQWQTVMAARLILTLVNSFFHLWLLPWCESWVFCCCILYLLLSPAWFHNFKSYFAVWFTSLCLLCQWAWSCLRPLCMALPSTRARLLQFASLAVTIGTDWVLAACEHSKMTRIGSRILDHH